MPYREVDPRELGLKDRHQYLLGGVGPRPIAFVGSLSADGLPNLAPFSFFNAFGANPVIIGISPAYSGRTGEPKDTMLNIMATGEFTVSIVSYPMVRQMHLAAGEFPPEVSEFEVSGLTPLPSLKVAPPGVAESPFVMECIFDRHIELGGDKGSGNLLLGEVVQYRIKEEVFGDDGHIDPYKMDQVGRHNLGWYSRVREGLFSIDRRQTDRAVGFQALPAELLTSTVLTGNDLALLAGVPEVPRDAEVPGDLKARLEGMSTEDRHREIKGLIEAGDIEGAWAVGLAGMQDEG